MVQTQIPKTSSIAAQASLLIAVLLAPSAVLASAGTVLGPRQYLRSTGEPRASGLPRLLATALALFMGLLAMARPVRAAELLVPPGVRLSTTPDTCTPSSSLTETFVTHPEAILLVARPFATGFDIARAIAGSGWAKRGHPHITEGAPRAFGERRSLHAHPSPLDPPGESQILAIRTTREPWPGDLRPAVSTTLCGSTAEEENSSERGPSSWA